MLDEIVSTSMLTYQWYPHHLYFILDNILSASLFFSFPLGYGIRSFITFLQFQYINGSIFLFFFSLFQWSMQEIYILEWEAARLDQSVERGAKRWSSCSLLLWIRHVDWRGPCYIRPSIHSVPFYQSRILFETTATSTPPWPIYALDGSATDTSLAT